MDERIKEIRLQAVLAEYAYVSGLIPLYREVEAKALSTTGVVLAGIASLIAALSQTENPDRNAQGAVVALCAWLLVLFAAVEVTAQLRILRAAGYIKDVIYPRLHELAGTNVMGFESTPPLSLIGLDKSNIENKTVSNVLRANLLTSAPISFGIGATGFVLPFIGLIWIAGVPLSEAFTGASSWWFSFGLAGGIVSVILGTMGYRLTRSVELKKTKS